MGMDLGQKRTKPGRAQPNMNVTPLVDVVLVLLIIFMVIAPLLAKQFWLSLPNKAEKEPPHELSDKDQPVVVIATKAGEIKINHEVVSRSDFPAKLRRVLAAREPAHDLLRRRRRRRIRQTPSRSSTWRAPAEQPTIAVLTAPIGSR